MSMSDKKILAAAVHTAEQADFLEGQVAKAEEDLDRARAAVDAAEDALDNAEADAKAARALADEYAEAASGLGAFPDVSEIGVNQ